MQFGRGLFGWVLFIALAVMLFMLLNKGSTQYATIAYQRVRAAGSSRTRSPTLTIEGDKILGEFRGAETIGDKGEQRQEVLDRPPRRRRQHRE